MRPIISSIISLLDKHNVAYTVSEHEPTITSEDAARVRGVELKTGVKSMIAKSKDQYFLFVLPGNTKINWRKVKNILKIKDISLASENEVERLTGLTRGSIPPFGNILGIKTFFDQKVLENEFINFNAGSLTHSINMKSKDLVEIVKPDIMDFAE